ncbi:hypothetical protein LMG26411_00624 [Cupriavidus numazuensis]|uniref:Acyltransferase n=2 Tax=Cupriavidus numazuensis TaxID=221992 RepID=A0ABM8TAW7_9BURK|nr:hypothetical protein LMG26411_00624 [Cupriavidus numazuensis]
MLMGFPSDVARIARTTVAAVMSVSNVAFYMSSGYFDSKAAASPLLHTWSLSVEEQFYVAFPLLMYALRKRTHRSRVAVISGVALASFAWAVWLVDVDASAAFYLVPSRAWELMLGSLLAVGAIPIIRSRWVVELLGVLGLALIAASILLISQKTPFPGLAAVPPCLGAALLIYAGSAFRTRATAILESPIFRFVGLISYSLYLWHWPIWVFFCDAFRIPTIKQRIALLVLCGVVAWLSYLLIEKPFRRSAQGGGNRRPLTFAAIGAASMCAIAISAALVSAARTTLPHSVEATLAYLDYDATKSMRRGECFIDDDAKRPVDLAAGDCLKVSPDKENVLLLGDSHAAHLWGGFSASRPDVNFMQATVPACKPILSASSSHHCNEVMRYVFEKFLPAQRVDVILLSARWGDQDAAGILESVNRLRQYSDRVVVIGPTAEYDQVFPRLLARSIRSGDSGLVARHLRPEQEKMDAKFAVLPLPSGVQYVSAYQALCEGGCVAWAENGVPLLFDDNHLTEAGARLLGDRVLGFITPRMQVRTHDSPADPAS